MAVKSKSYLNNPALQFISTALVDEAAAAEEPVREAAPAPVQSAPAAPVAAPQSVQTAAAPAAAPQEKFIVPMKPVYVEVRSKRFNALMQPSLYNNLSKLASLNGVSVNELMHRVLEKYVEDNLPE